MEHMEPLGGFANLSAQSLARLCFVSVRTARRWLRAGMAPKLAVEWLVLVHRGDLSKINAQWSEWCLRRDGTLGNAHGWQFTVHEIMAIPFLQSALSAYRVEVRRLRDKLKRSQALQPVTVTMTMQLPATSLSLDDFATFEPITFLDAARTSATA